MTNDDYSPVTEAETILGSLVIHLPRHGECLLCYVARGLPLVGCDSSLRLAQDYRDLRAPRATALERRLWQAGGFCDCEIFLNAFELHPRWWTPAREIEHEGDVDIIEAEPPARLPGCTGVRGGSTRPCELWVPRRW